MTGHVDTERILDAFLAPAHDQLPERVLEASLADITRTPQRRALRVPWRLPYMPALTRTTGFATVALVAVVAAGGLLYLNAKGPSGPGAQASAPATVPTPTATGPSPTPKSTYPPLQDGRNEPGVYTVQLALARAPLRVTLTLTDAWDWFGEGLIPVGPGPGAPGGLAIVFFDVASLNGDPCHWRGPGDDVDAGSTVADLVAALEAQTAYTASDPVNVTIGGYSGQRIDITAPTEPFPTQDPVAPACDDGVMRLWNTHDAGEDDLYVQGPANRWQANILDVEGKRVVVVAHDFPGTKAADRARLDAVLASMVIEP
jgi:hypothetical protein